MRRKIWRKVQGATLLFLLVLTACTNINPTATLAVPTATLPPLATFTPRYTATPVFTVTPRPTFTYTPSITPTPLPPSDTPTPSPTPPVIGRVTSVQAAVNMREGPGVNFTVIQGVPNNADVIILAANEDERWYNIRLEDGTEGWIAADLVRVVPSPTPLASDTPLGVVVQSNGTPLATSILGGEPITATPSDTPTPRPDSTAATPTRRTPGTVTATPSLTATPTPGGNIPTITPGPGGATLSATTTLTPPPTGSPTAASGAVGPPRERYDVLAYCEQFNEVPPPLAAGTTIDIFWGWIVSEPQYMQQHLDNVIYEVRLDGRLLTDWRRYATNLYQTDGGDWAMYWYVPIEAPLTSGTHTITYRVAWNTRIFDGYREFGPGTATEFEAGGCTFEVR